MKKTKIMGIFAIVVTLFFGSLTAFAAERQSDLKGDISGEYVLTEQQYATYLAGLSAYDMQQRTAKEREALRCTRSIARAAQKITVPGTFTMYQQQTDTYCIPATIRSILMYINGESPSQKDIADTTGTDPTKIAGYLNDRQDKNYYLYVQSPDKESMCKKLYYTIANLGLPASIGISGTTANNWYYVTNGHSLVVNGIYDDFSIILIADPLGDRVEGCPYFYTKTADEVSGVCTRIVY